MIVREMAEGDIDEAALIHSKTFPRQNESQQWLSCAHSAFPKSLCFVVEAESKIVGYIIWTQKSGFRAEAIVELEQIAIHPQQQNKGVGQELILQSKALVKRHLIEQGSRLKCLLVSTRDDNYAQHIYRKALGAEVEARIANLFSADEVYMVAKELN